MTGGFEDWPTRKNYTAADMASIAEANSKKPMCPTTGSGQPTPAEIYNAYLNCVRSSFTTARGHTMTYLNNEPNCRIHCRYQMLICLNCLGLLCAECYENTPLQHRVYRTWRLISEANNVRKLNLTYINETAETLRTLVREMKMKITTTRWIGMHRIAMLRKRREHYSEGYFEQLLALEMTAIGDNKRKQQKHLEDLIRAQKGFARISTKNALIWSVMEVLRLPEMKEEVRQLLSRHTDMCPPVQNTLLRGLTVKMKARQWKHRIIAEGSLNRPWGVCCTNEDEIFVADRSNHQIRVYNAKGRLINTIGSRGNGRLQFETPAGIAFHPNGNIVVVDKGNNRLQMITRSGQWVRTFGQGLDHPMDVACNSFNEIAVTNEKEHCVHIYDSYGQRLRKSDVQLMWPDSRYDSSRKITPRGVCFTSNNEIAVTDFKRNTIIILDRSLLKVLYELRPPGSEKIEKMQSIACDQHCTFVTADKHNKVHMFSFDGQKRLFCEGPPIESTGFRNPTGVCILPDSSICVAESGNNRIHIIT